MPFRVGTNRIGRLVVGGIPTWSPSDFTNVQYWWTADAGVSESGGVVSVWTDQINSFDMEQPITGNRPTLSTQAGLNGENVISFDGVDDFLHASTSTDNAGADLTHLVIYYISNTSPGAGVIFGDSLIGGNVGRVWLDGLSGNLRNWEAMATNSPFDGTGYIIESPMTTGAKSWKYRYDSSAGDFFTAYNTLTETSQFTGGRTSASINSGAVKAMGATLNNVSNPTVFSSRYIEVDIAEAVVIYGSPTSQEMTNWKTYVNNKYGTIIS